MRLKRQVVFVLMAAVFVQCNHQDKTDPDFYEEETDGIQLAMHQQFMMTRDLRLNYVPAERLLAARSYMETLVNAARSTSTTALTWQERGPNNVGGRTRALLIDKSDASGNTVFAGSVGGGLFKTTNFLNSSPTWTVVNDFLPNLAITNLIQDNTNLNTMYATTGEGWLNADAIRGAGIYKSTDGGTTWNQIASTADFEYVQDFVIDNNGTMFAAIRNLTSSNRGVQRSTDGGTTWTQVLGAPLTAPIVFETGRAADLEVASNGDVYASLGVGTRGVLFKSSFAVNGANTGALGTWTEVTPIRGLICQRLELAIAPTNPQRLYLLMQDSASSQVIGLYRSSNGGAVWDSVGTPAGLNNGGASQTWFNLIAAVDPNNADILVVGGLSIGRSTNAGDTWTSISNSNNVHVDQHFLQYIGSAKLLIGCDGGIFYSTNIDAATPTYLNKNNGYNVTQYYACDYHPTSPNYFLAGAQDNFTQRFTSPGINTTTNATGGDGGFCHIDQTDGLIQITSNTGNRYNVSTNGGSTFSNAISNNRGQFINPTDYDDNNDVLYCGDDAGAYFYITGWAGTPVGTVVSVAAIGSQEVTAVKVDPFTANTIWLGVSFGGSRIQVIKLTNANSSTPTVVISAFLGTSTGINNTVNGNLSSIDVDPANSNHILAIMSNFGAQSVWESTNGGASFSSIEGNLPDMPIWWGIFAPANAQLNGSSGGNGGILLGTDLGVWTTSQISGAGTQWIPNNSGLANVSTHMLKLRPSDNLVAAATHGRGLFTATLTTVITGVPDNVITKDFIKYISAATGQLQIVTGNLQTRTMTVQLVNMKGQLVHNSQGRYQNSSIDIRNLQSGVYIVKITGDKKENYQQQFVKK